MGLNQKLIDLRTQKGLSQEAVAEQAGISRVYYTMIENGTKCPAPKVAKSIAKVLGIEWTIFFPSFHLAHFSNYKLH